MLAQVSAGTFHKPKPTRGISLPDARVRVPLPIFMFGYWKTLDECYGFSVQIMRICTCRRYSFWLLHAGVRNDISPADHRQIIGFEQKESFLLVTSHFGDGKEEP
jgi:hypothetical protein